MSKPISKDGRSSFLKAGEEVTHSSTSFAGGWVKILALGASSYFDSLKDSSITNGKAVGVGDIVKLPAFSSSTDNPLEEGDKVLSLEPKATCWTTDVNVGMSEGTIDRTTQCDIIKGAKDVVGDGNVQDSGAINGLFETGSETQRELEGLFVKRIISKGGKLTAIDKQDNQEYLHLFCYREQTEEGEVEVYRIRRMRITSISEGQPNNGVIPFSFNYEALQMWNYEHTVPSAS